MSALDPTIILIVDDYEDDAKLLQIMLTNAGILNPTRVALSAEEAITYLRGVPPYSNRAIYPLPSAIFVDLKLPGIDGFELLRWLRTRDELKGSFVVVLSAAGDMVSIQAAYALGANSFLVKPCRAADLENLVIAYPDPWLRAIIPPPSTAPPASPSPPG
jgi:CheY-like chemotaxis protein